MRKKLIPKGQFGMTMDAASFANMMYSLLPKSRVPVDPAQQSPIPLTQTDSFQQATNIPHMRTSTMIQGLPSPGSDGTGTGQGAGLFSNQNSIAQGVNNFAASGAGGLAASGIDMLSTNLGLKPNYQINTKAEGLLSTAEGISKNFGNPLVNAAGDAIAGGIGKLMGFNTDKVVGGGMAGVNAVSNVLSNFGPIGMAAGIALKAGNMLGGKNLEDFNTDSRVQQSGGYTGSAKKIQSTADKYGGGFVSGVDRLFGSDVKYRNRIQEQKRIQNRIKGILSESDMANEAAAASSDMFRIKNQMGMQNNSYLYNGTLSIKHGGRIQKIIKAQNGGKMNVIPEGALHAHKHKLHMDDITTKGIPVISREDGGEITQHAEIERNEIVFTKEVSDRLEQLWKQYQDENLTKKEKDEIAIQAGELLTFEIIENTDDRTGLMTTV